MHALLLPLAILYHSNSSMDKLHVCSRTSSSHKFPQFLLTLFTSVVFATITYITKIGNNVIDLINNEEQVESSTSELSQLVVAASTTLRRGGTRD